VKKNKKTKVPTPAVVLGKGTPAVVVGVGSRRRSKKLCSDPLCEDEIHKKGTK
jgi:hypothetical protein